MAASSTASAAGRTVSKRMHDPGRAIFQRSYPGDRGRGDHADRPGRAADVVVTERGIAINPRRGISSTRGKDCACRSGRLAISRRKSNASAAASRCGRNWVSVPWKSSNGWMGPCSTQFGRWVRKFRPRMNADFHGSKSKVLSVKIRVISWPEFFAILHRVDQLEQLGAVHDLDEGFALRLVADH